METETPKKRKTEAGERGITEGDRGRIPRQGGNDAGGDLQSWAKERALGCVNSTPAARGSQEAGFTQPRAHSFPQPCKRLRELRIVGQRDARCGIHVTS